MSAARRVRHGLICLALAAAMTASWSWAREAENPEEAVPVRTIPVKCYTPLKPAAVWKVADANTQVDVRFTDTFDRFQTTVPSSMREVRLGSDAYRIAVLMITESDLCLLVPVEQKDTLEKIRPFQKARQFAVEGTIIGIVNLRRCVLVDRILTETEDKSVIKYELTLKWPGTGTAPKKIVEPGEYDQVEFPCRYAKGETETFIVLVEQKTREELNRMIEQRQKAAAAAVAKTEGEGEAKPVEKPVPKSYTTYRSEAVYKYAVTGTKLNVQFKDTIKSAAPPSRDIKQVPPRLGVIRLPGERPIRIAVAFDTYIGLTCVVPADNKKLLARVGCMLPGLDVLIKGTIIPPLGAYKLVLVDEIEFPQDVGEVETPDVWMVTVFWDPQRPKVLYEPGKYSVLFECRNVVDRKEELQIELEAKRVILEEAKVEKDAEVERK